MPLRTWDSKADWDAAYDVGAEPEGHPNTRPEIRLHYNRYVVAPVVRSNVIQVAQALGWGSTTRLVIVGCGFGWSIETLVDELGLAQVLGVDVSAFIQSNKQLNEDAEIAAAIQSVGLDPTSGEGLGHFNRLRGDGGPRAKKFSLILNENINLNSGRNRVKNSMGGPHTYEIFTESVLESLTDLECQQASAAAHSISTGRVSHLVFTSSGGQDSSYNWKTLEQWKALIPSDTFVEAGTFRVI